MRIYERIKERARAADLTIAQVERKAGLKQGSICRWDEHIPGVDKVKAAAVVLGIQVDVLLQE